MERFQTFEQYKEMICTAKNAGYKFSNCFFLPAAIKQKITIGTLCFLWIENGLLLFDDCSDFYRCYYYLHSTKLPNCVLMDKDAVIEFPYNGVISAEQEDQIQRIERMGFCLGRESGMMSALPERIKQSCTSDEEKTRMVCNADSGDTAEILELFRHSFNPLFAFLPNQNELETSINTGRVLVVRNENQEVIAALNSEFERGVASIRQVAVNPAFRGRGDGKIIMRAYHRKYLGEAKQFQHWVDLNNTVAVNMYKQLGYEFSIRKANEYIYLKSAKKYH